MDAVEREPSTFARGYIEGELIRHYRRSSEVPRLGYASLLSILMEMIARILVLHFC